MTNRMIGDLENVQKQHRVRQENASELEQEWVTQTKEIDEAIECTAKEILHLEKRLGFILIEDTKCNEIEAPDDSKPRPRSELIATLGRISHKLAENIRRLQSLDQRLDI